MTTSRLFSLYMPLIVTALLPCSALGQQETLAVNPQTGELLATRFNNTSRWSYRRLPAREQRHAFIQLAERALDHEAWCAGNAPRVFECGDLEGFQASHLAGSPLTAVFYKARLHDDTLTVQLRFRNEGQHPARLKLEPSRDTRSFYIEGGGKRLFILEDDQGEFQAKSALNEVLEPGEIESWWARFPAPPRGATTFDLHIPSVTFRDVPLSTD